MSDSTRKTVPEELWSNDKYWGWFDGNSLTISYESRIRLARENLERVRQEKKQ